MHERDCFCRNKPARSLYRTPRIHQHRYALWRSKTSSQPVNLLIADVIGVLELIQQSRHYDPVVSTFFKVANQSVLDTVRISEVDAHTQRIELLISATRTFDWSNLRIGPCFTEQLQPDTRIDERKRSTNQNRLATRARGTNTFE